MYCEDFLCWLSGFILLLHDEETITERQKQIILSHAKLCYSTEEGFVTPFILRFINNIHNIESDEICGICTNAFVVKQHMNSRELAYFIQGYFEINETSNYLSVENARLIKYEMDKNISGFGDPLHTIYNILDKMTNDNINKSAQDISDILEDIFIHAIDPSYNFTDEKNKQLQEIHDEYK